MLVMKLAPQKNRKSGTAFSEKSLQAPRKEKTKLGALSIRLIPGKNRLKCASIKDEKKHPKGEGVTTKRGGRGSKEKWMCPGIEGG